MSRTPSSSSCNLAGPDGGDHKVLTRVHLGLWCPARDGEIIALALQRCWPRQSRFPRPTNRFHAAWVSAQIGFPVAAMEATLDDLGFSPAFRIEPDPEEPWDGDWGCPVYGFGRHGRLDPNCVVGLRSSAVRVISRRGP
jgi:hypothetical protein